MVGNLAKIGRVEQRASVWQNRQYLLLMAGELISGLGDQIYLFVLPWLVYELLGSASSMSALRAVEYLPQVFFGLFVGVLVDRLDRRRLALAGLTAQALLVGTLALFGQLGSFQVWAFYVIGFNLALAGLVTGSSLMAILPSIVPKEQLTVANAGMGVVDNIVRVGGPAIAGLMVALMGSLANLWLDAISFLALIGTVWLLKVPPQESSGMRSFRQVMTDIGEGLQFLYRFKPLFWATLWITVDNVGGIFRASILLFHLREVLHLSSREAGIVMVGGPVGMLLVNAAVPTLKRYVARGTLMTAGGFAVGVGSVLMMLSQTGWQLIAAYALTASGSILLGLNYSVFRQAITPSALLGRTGTAVLVLARVLVPVAAGAAGLLADTYGSGLVLGIAGCISLVTATTVLLSPLRTMLDTSETAERM